jgi:hypothetical protein
MARSGRPFVILAIVGVAGLLVLIAADRFARPELIGPGLLLFALGTLAAGGHAIVMRYSYEGSRASYATWVFEGSAAVLIGVVLVILGLAFGVAGVAFVLGAEHKLVDHVLARPGLVLVALGTASCAGGGARLLGAREWRGSLRRSSPRSRSGSVACSCCCSGWRRSRPASSRSWRRPPSMVRSMRCSRRSARRRADGDAARFV